MISQIIPCPKTISETGYIKIVGDATKAPTNQDRCKWDYKAVSHDPIKQVSIGQAFEVTKQELETWMK